MPKYDVFNIVAVTVPTELCSKEPMGILKSTSMVAHCAVHSTKTTLWNKVQEIETPQGFRSYVARNSMTYLVPRQSVGHLVLLLPW